MVSTTPFKRLILRAVLRQVNPMVIRLLSVPDYMDLPEFHEVMRAILAWDGDLGSAASERERLKGLLDIYHSSLASRNNEATRILTVMGTVSLPAVVIASFFGMSLKYPNWMSGPQAILMVIGIILVVTVGLLWYLKRRQYL